MIRSMYLVWVDLDLQAIIINLQRRLRDGMGVSRTRRRVLRRVVMRGSSTACRVTGVLYYLFLACNGDDRDLQDEPMR